MTPKLFSELGLSPEILKAIERLGFEQASPIQAEAIPVIQSGRDVVGQSQTGSGKTAAFAIPAIEKVDVKNRAVQVLILCPTRELAVQVSEEVHKLACFKPGVRALPVYGGQSYERQFAGLKAGANIVIGTPGRVMDHMERGTLRLDQIHTIILDEADEMLDMGFREDIEFILKAMPAERQTVLFSATVPPPIQHLIRNYTRDAVRVQIEAKALTVPTVEQVYYEVDRRWKLEALTRLIELHNVTLGIIFCNTQRMVDELSEHLHAAGYSADALHGGMAQAARDRVMKKFRTGSLEFLVATDVAARGIDVDDIQVVFNYDLPYDVEDYVHRIGRTGRAGRSGLAITFVSGREFFLIRQIEHFTRQRVRRGDIPTEGEIGRAKENQLLQRVRGTLQAGEFQRRDHFIETLLEEGFDSVAIASATLHLLTGGDEPETAKSEPKSMSPRPATAPAVAGAVVPSVVKPAVAAVKRPAPTAAPKPVPPPKAVTAPKPATVTPSPVAAAETDFPEGESAVAAAVVPLPTAEITEASPKAAVLEPGATSQLEVASGAEVAEPAAEPAPVTVAAVPPSKAPVKKSMAPVKPVIRSATGDRPPFYENRPPASPRPEPFNRPPEPRREWDRPSAPPGPGYDRPSYDRPRDDRPSFDRPGYDRPPGPPRPGFDRPSYDRPRDDRPRDDRPRDDRPRDDRPNYDRPATRGPQDFRPPDNRFRDREPMRPVRPITEPNPEPRSVEMSMMPVWLGVGQRENVTPEEVITCIQGHSGLPATVIGGIEIHEEHTLVDVAGEHARGVVLKLKHGLFRGKPLRAKLANR